MRGIHKKSDLKYSNRNPVNARNFSRSNLVIDILHIDKTIDKTVKT